MKILLSDDKRGSLVRNLNFNFKVLKSARGTKYRKYGNLNSKDGQRNHTTYRNLSLQRKNRKTCIESEKRILVVDRSNLFQ